MGEHRAAHLTDEQLAWFEDGELSPRYASHLDTCAECAQRLRDLRAAEAAYVEYRDTLRGPALPPVPKPWRSLEALLEEYEARHSRRTRLWWQIPAAAAAVCLALAAVALLLRPAPRASAEASELLTRSATAELPSGRMIEMRLRGRTLVRPAVLITEGGGERGAELAHLEMLFNEAHYSWRDPLSARSFQAWRTRLHDKRDKVSVIDAGGADPAYRVETDTAAGVLRSASLTLRGRDLRPTNGAFQFEGEDPLEMGEAAAAPARAASPGRLPARREPPRETPAGPADTLHVLAALSEIGADVGEPIDVSEDAQHQVLVRATGLSADRREQVTAVLHGLPHVRLDLDAVPTGEQLSVRRAETPKRYSTAMPDALRRQFEGRLGGAVAFQETTDRVLEASGTAVSQAHAVEVLANRFPPEIESGLAAQDRKLLDTLRQGHMAELRQLTARIRTDLKPVLPAAERAATSGGSPWQERAHEAVAAAQSLDEGLNRLLAGSYSQADGEAMLHALAGQLDRLDGAIRR